MGTKKRVTEDMAAPVASTSQLTVDGMDGREVEEGLSVVEGLPCLQDGNYESSYTWHSAEKYNSSRPQPQGQEEGGEGAGGHGEPVPWIIGIDEAGRGPVLGPQVYGVAYCPIAYSDGLKALGFADSKTLTHVKRVALMEELMSGQARENQVEYGVRVMHPRDIAANMLMRNNYSLNAQSQDATVALIQDVLAKGYPVTHVYVDPVGPHEVYQQKLSKLFPGIDFTVVPKADALFPIVSAASIVAKVTRDTFMETWKFSEAELSAGKMGTEFGSGYPSDPKTVAWLEDHFDPVFGYPGIARQSWGTVRQLYDKRGWKVKWTEEESVNSIKGYFQSAKPGEDRERPAVLKDLGLTSVSGL